MDRIGKIKQILEEMQYRTDQKTPEELYQLALELFERTAAYRFGGKSEQALPHSPSSVERAPENITPNKPAEVEEAVIEPSAHMAPAVEKPTASAPAESNSPLEDTADHSALTPSAHADAATDASEPASGETRETSEQLENPEKREVAHQTASGDTPEVAHETPSRETPDLTQRADTPEGTHQTESPAPPQAETPPTGPVKKMKIGFNDRFAFINKLFHGDANEYDQVIQAIERMSDLHQAENYVNMVVKPDFDWSEAEEFEERFRMCLEQHFA